MLNGTMRSGPDMFAPPTIVQWNNCHKTRNAHKNILPPVCSALWCHLCHGCWQKWHPGTKFLFLFWSIINMVTKTFSAWANNIASVCQKFIIRVLERCKKCPSLTKSIIWIVGSQTIHLPKNHLITIYLTFPSPRPDLCLIATIIYI